MRGKIVTVGPRYSLAGALAALLVCGVASEARADGDAVKGTIGGAMLGAEAVMITESALRLRPGWLYLVGGAAGALGGGYLGHELSDDANNRPPAFLLAGGIALIIPTIMGVLTATQYEPYDAIHQMLPGDDDRDRDDPDGEDREDGDIDGSGDDGDPWPEGGAAERSATRLELPSFGLAQAFSRDELARFNLRQVTEFHLSVLRGVF